MVRPRRVCVVGECLVGGEEGTIVDCVGDVSAALVLGG